MKKEIRPSPGKPGPKTQEEDRTPAVGSVGSEFDEGETDEYGEGGPDRLSGGLRRGAASFPDDFDM